MRCNVLSQVIFSDNQGAIKIATANQSTARTRHLSFKLQYTRETVRKESISIRYVNTQDNVADIFTKSLGRIQFQKLADKLYKFNQN